MLSLDMVSRLKGIETYVVPVGTFVSAKVTLDMVSRLKGIETRRVFACRQVCVHPLDMLSRLKGIETRQFVR